MIECYPTKGLGNICKLFGKSRQAWYKIQQYKEIETMQDQIIIDLVKPIKIRLPHLGVRKVYERIESALIDHRIKIGRDKLFNLLSSNGLLVKRKRLGAYTTNSNHRFRKYPNLIIEKTIEYPESVWVCDITYIRVKAGFNYLSLITDAYSRKIVGYCLSRNLDTKGCIHAVSMALNSRIYPERKLIHHSDRGIQYCSRQYVDLLNESDILISMTQNGNPYENAIAERVNGILKTEHRLSEVFENHFEANKVVEVEIDKYNNERPHASCDYLTPSKAHLISGVLKKRWKSYPYKKQDYEQG